MSKIEDGGQAYPCYVSGIGWDSGMSLRDYFAGMALQGLVNRMPDEMIADLVTRIRGGRLYIEAAYSLADAMLAERKK